MYPLHFHIVINENGYYVRVDFETKIRELSLVVYATSRGNEHCKTIYVSETEFRKNANDNQSRNITKWLCLFWQRYIVTLNKQEEKELY